MSDNVPSEQAAPRRDFPIPRYDTLSVIEVLPLFGNLEPAQLEVVWLEEATGRAHPWILSRIEALLKARPVT